MYDAYTHSVSSTKSSSSSSSPTAGAVLAVSLGAGSAHFDRGTPHIKNLTTSSKKDRWLQYQLINTAGDHPAIFYKKHKCTL